MTVIGSWCGLVKIAVMKTHNVLQAHSSQQAQSRHLRRYEQIRLSEQGKVQGFPTEDLQTKNISCLTCAEK